MSNTSMPMKSSSQRIRPVWLVRKNPMVITMGCTFLLLLLAMPSCSAFSPVGGTNNLPSSSKGTPLYSQATQERIRNLDVSTEFSKLAQKMQTPPEELKVVLEEQLSKATSMTEEEEYMDWLLSGFETGIDAQEINTSKPGAAASIAVRKFAQAPIQPRPSKHCVRDDTTASTHTNNLVAQTHIVVPSKGTDMISTVVETIKYAVETHINTNTDNNNSESRFTTPPKIVVFFPKPKLAQFYAEIFQTIHGGVLLTSNTGDGKAIRIPTWELHSKRFPEFRNRVNDAFQQAEVGVLFTSDTRGVEYPNVSHVLQFGMPTSEEQYIQRLGLTGTNGRKGKAWLVLQEWESSFLKELNAMNIIQGIDVPQSEELVDRIVRGKVLPHSRAIACEVRQRVRGGDRRLARTGIAAYVAFLEYYTRQRKRTRTQGLEDLVALANEFARSVGFEEAPELRKATLGRMKLVGVPGINMAELDGTSRHAKRNEGRGRGRGRSTGRGSGRYGRGSAGRRAQAHRYRRESHKSRSVR